MGFELVLRILERIKKVRHWMLLQSGGNFVIRYFKNLKGKKNGARLKLGWGKKKQSFILSKIGLYLVIFVARTMFMLLSMFRYDYGVLLILS